MQQERTPDTRHPVRTTVHRSYMSVLRSYLFIIKFEPLLAGRPDVSIVVSSMNTAAVDEHTVQLVQVAHAAVCIWRQELAILYIQVQLIRELIPVVDLQGS